MAEHWAVKYRPKSTLDVPSPGVGKLKKFLEEFRSSRKKSVMIHGPSGSCKTCAVYALANELDLEIIDINASDVRNVAALKESVGGASKQMSLFGKNKLIFVDEVDQLSGVRDRGAAAELVKIVEKSAFPIVFAANDAYERKLSGLRKKASLIEFPSIDSAAIAEILGRICINESVPADLHSVKTLAIRSGGDLRSAINDLQSLVAGSRELTKEILDTLGDRDREETMHNALNKVLKSSDPQIAISAFNSVNEDLDECFLWLDENLPKEYTNPEDRKRAYEALSRADVYRGRIRRRQHWRFLSYVNALLTAGVSVSKDRKYASLVNYEQSKRLLKIWQANMKYQKRKVIAEKIAAKTHSSMRQALANLPYLRVLFQNKHSSSAQIAEQCELDSEEVEWLEK